MTANEIADGLAQMHIEKDVNGLFNKRIQNMLRQQEVEIERITSKYEEMLTVKELTDEEIRHIQAQCHLKDVGYDGFIMRFARAILRKAQEK